jgi:DNA modification methylase
MAHQSENSRRLRLTQISVDSATKLAALDHDKAATYLLWLPFGRTQQDGTRSTHDFEEIAKACANMKEQSTICVLTTPEDAAALLPYMVRGLHFHHWVAVKTAPDVYTQLNGQIPRRHAALLIFTRYKGTLKHTITRIQYTHCSACGNTTKDYGGKAHRYHSYGTSASDVWRDFEWNPALGVSDVVERLADLFGIDSYEKLVLLDLHECESLLPVPSGERPTPPAAKQRKEPATRTRRMKSKLIHGDCLKVLRALPTNLADLCFADLPYNLKKKYYGWKDDLELLKYFAWCDEWLAELCRILKPGHTLVILNIPFWAARHFQCLASTMNFQAWIAWDALGYPVRKIMPAHYGILCFSKGIPRPLPGDKERAEEELNYLSPKGELYCIRRRCIKERVAAGIDDRATLTDVWSDVFRLTHNSRRVNHPCQLPPLLMRRVFALFTKKDELILDCFNGAGTSTLVAAQMSRRYVGIEKSKRYHNLAVKRHRLLEEGVDPFDKDKQVPKTKNSHVRRLPGRKNYAVFKKELQMEVKRISEQLGRLPTYDDVATHSQHPIHYFKEYFTNWSEVRAAARTTGMVE